MRNIPTAMTQDELKQIVAREAIKYVVDDAYIGVGSGSTANFFIDELAAIKGRIKGAVASSIKTAERLRQLAKESIVTRVRHCTGELVERIAKNI